MTARGMFAPVVGLALGLGLGCDPQLLPPPPAVNFLVTGPAEIHELTAHGRLAVTVTIPGLLAESPLVLTTDETGLSASGFFEIALEEQQQSTAEVRLYGTDDNTVTTPDVLLLEQTTAVTLEFALNAIEVVFDPAADGAFADDPRFDLNQNQRSNYDDLKAACTPGIPPPLLALSSPLLQFSAVGTDTDRAVVVFSNAQSSGNSPADVDTPTCGAVHPEALRVSAKLLDAPGVVFETFVAETGDAGGSALIRSELTDTVDDLIVRPREQTLLNTAFTSPDNVRVTGAVLLSAEHCRCGYATQSYAAVVANAQFPPQVVPLDYVPGVLPDDDALAYLAFPAPLLFSGQGLPINVPANVATVDGFDAAVAYVATIPASHQVSVLLSDADADLDLAVFSVDGAGALAPLDDARSAFIGPASVEGLELSFDTTTQIAVLIGHKPGQALGDDAGANLVVHAYGGPALAGISPFGGAVAGGTEVTLRGARFDAASQVLFGGVLADDVEVAPDGQTLTCTTPAGSLLPGLNPAAVTVQNPGGQSSTLPSSFVYWPGTPTLSSLNPLAVAPGGVVTLSGSGFSNVFGTPAVTVDDNPAQVIGVSASELLFVAPDGPAAGDAHDVSVQNRVPQGQTAEPAATLAAALTYIDALSPPPVLASLDPTIGPQSGGFVLTAVGADFAPGAELLVGPLALISNVIDPTTLTAAVPPLALSGVLDVRVRNPDGLTSDPLPLVIEPTVLQGAPSIELVTSQNGVHAAVAGDVLQLFGSNLNLSDAVLCTISDGTGTYLAAVGGQAGLSVSCVVVDPLPEGLPLTARVDFAGGQSATSPVFFAEAPRVTAIQTVGTPVSGADFSVIVTGQHLFGSQVTGVAFERPDGTRTTLVPTATASETVLSLDIPAGTLAQASHQVFVTYPGGFEAGAPLPFTVGGSCGNNVAEGIEQCDGMDLNDTTCQTLGYETGALSCAAATCQFDTALCGSCQDGKHDPGEQCDQQDLGGQSCLTLGYDKGVLGCADTCFFDLADCSFGVCGDNICDPDETGASCANDCTADCGDDVCAGGETCLDCANDCGLCVLELVSGGDVNIPAYAPAATPPQVRVITGPTGVPVTHNDVDLEIQSFPTAWTASVTETGANADGLYNVNITAGRAAGVDGVVTVAGAAGAPIASALDIPVHSVDIPVGNIVAVFNRSNFQVTSPAGIDGDYPAAYAYKQSNEQISSFALAPGGDIYFAREEPNDRGYVMRIDAQGIMHRIGSLDPSGDFAGVPGPAGQASVGRIDDLDLGPDGTLYAFVTPANVSDPVIVAYTPSTPGGVIDQTATVTRIPFTVLSGSTTTKALRVMPDGRLLVAGSLIFNGEVYLLDPVTGVQRQLRPPCTDDSNNHIARMLPALDVASNGTFLYGSDEPSHCLGSRGIYAYNPSDGFTARIDTYTPISLAPARGFAYSVDETAVLVAPPSHHVFRYDAAGHAQRVVGPPSSSADYQGNNGPATSARINSASDLHVHDATGDLYFIDQNQSVIRMVRGVALTGRTLVADASPDTSGGDPGDDQTVLPTERLPLALRVHIDATLDGAPIDAEYTPVRITSNLPGLSVLPTTPWARNVFGAGNTQALITPGPTAGAGTLTATAVDFAGRDAGAPHVFTFTVDDPPAGTVLRRANHDVQSGADLAPLPPASRLRFDFKNLERTPVAAHSTGIYIGETNRDRVIRLFPDGSAEVFGGGGTVTTNGTPVADLALPDLRGLAVDGDTLYIATAGDDQIRKVDLTDPDHIATAAVGGGPGAPLSVANVLNDRNLAVDALSVNLPNPDALTAHNGRLYFTAAGDTNDVFAYEGGVLWRYIADVGCTYDGGFPAALTIHDLATDPVDGTLYLGGLCNDLCSRDESITRLIDTNDVGVYDETISIDGDNCGLNGRVGLTAGPDQGLYATVTTEHRVKRLVWPDPVSLTTLVGTGVAGQGPVGPRATCALSEPEGLAFDGNDLVIADNDNFGVRVVHDLIGDLP